MGIIKKILGAVLGLLAAIGGLLGLGDKKDNGSYFLDLSQDGGSAAQAAPAPTPKASIQPGAGAQAVAPAPVAATTQAAAPVTLPKAAQAASAEEQEAGIKAQREAAQATIEQGKQSLVAETAAMTVSFADIVMVPTETMAKRRPGPSLAGFQEMAKEMAPRR